MVADLRRYIRTLVGCIVELIAGSTPAAEQNVPPMAIPDDIDKYLRATEQRYQDIRSGTEKTVIWIDPEHRRKTPWSLIYLHGFSASRQEIAPLPEQVAAALGANLFYSRLTGHGRNADAMATITINSLLHDAVEALTIGEKLGERVIVMGSSTGATLATWLACHDSHKAIAALVMLSPNFGLHRAASELLLLPWGKHLLRLVEGTEYHFEARNDLQQQYWTTRYPSKALLPLMGVVKLVRDQDLTQVRQPTLVLYAPDDQVINARAVVNAFARFGSRNKALHAIAGITDPQRHTLAGRILSPESTPRVAELITDFLTTVKYS